MAAQQAKGYPLLPEDDPFAVLYRNVMEELAHLERINFGIVQQAAKQGAWQAAAWILERRFPLKTPPGASSAPLMVPAIHTIMQAQGVLHGTSCD